MANKSDIKNVLIKKEGEDRRSIVFCETLFQLFGTLCVFLKYKDHAPVDIVLSDDSDFSKAKEVLEKEGPFENVYTLSVRKKIHDLWQKTSREEREKIGLDPGSYLPEIELEHKYTDLWVNLDSMAPKMFYYKLLKYGMTPYVHFVDEGTSSYIIDFSATERDFIDHEAVFGDMSFENRASDMWLNEPRLYSGAYDAIPLYAVPKEILQDEAVKDLFKRIFGYGTLPKERYIYFEESFVADGRTTNDLDLFFEIANVVGKDNIIVKRHPRNPINRFDSLGFKVMENQSVPWEMMLLANDVTDKVLISVGSSATLTPYCLYGMKPKAFLLKKLLIGFVPYLQKEKMSAFFEKAEQLFNQNTKNLYYPSCIKELLLALEYVDSTAAAQPEDSLFDNSDAYLYDPLAETDEEEPEEEIIEEAAEEAEEEEVEDITFLEERERIIEEKKAKLTKPYVSVVVPVYNVENYLKRCLNSLVFQTIDEVEILVVNDGSPDNSQAIIDEYAERFPGKIVPLMKENGGLSSARKMGAEHAKGHYIGFVDSDDWVDCRFCEKCLDALLFEDTKAAVFGINHVYNNGSIVKGKLPREHSMEAFLLDSPAAFTAKVYEREYFMENVKFLNMWYEDIPVINPMLSHLDKVSLLEDRLYYYVREREGSITNSKVDIRQLDCTKAEKIAIENTNPKYRHLQVARSISRLVQLNNETFYDHIVSFVKEYADELRSEEVRANITEGTLVKIDDILDNKTEKIAPIIYLNGFGVSEEERNALAGRYATSVFWNCEKIEFVDETNCDVKENEVVNKLYNDKRFDELAKYFTAKKIYETGGVALHGMFNFSTTLNKLRFSEAFLGFAQKENFTDNIFGAKKECKLFGDACRLFIEKEAEWSMAECFEYFAVGETGISLNGRTQKLPSGIEVYDAKTFIFRADDTNICSMLEVTEDGDSVIVPLEAYTTQVEFLYNSYTSLVKSNAALRKNLAKKNKSLAKWKRRATRRQEKLEKRNRKIEKQAAKLEKMNKDLVIYNKMKNKFIFRVYRKLFMMFHK